MISPERKAEYDKARYQELKEQIRQRQAVYNRENKDKRKSRDSKNADARRQTRRAHYAKNKDRLNLEQSRQKKQLREKSPSFRVACRQRQSISKAVRQSGAVKAGRAVHLLGCSFVQFKEHLEERFLPGMSWDNYGKWQIDHIRPLASFDLTDPEQQAVAFHFSNQQPLWALQNRLKSDRWSIPAE